MGILDIFRQRKNNLDGLAEKRDKTRKARGRIRIKSRLSEVFDPKSSKPLFREIQAADPLHFPGYAEKTANLARRSGLVDAFKCEIGAIGGRAVVGVELVPEFLMGSMGTALGEAVCCSAEFAEKNGLPLVIFSASGGARMQEGMFSLMQMAKTSAAIRKFSDAGGFFVSVLTHPTTGGVTASFASLGDIIIAEPGALIGFAGPRVIEQTIRSSLPEGFQSAEFQCAHGFVDMVVKRKDMRSTLVHLLELHAGRQPLGVSRVPNVSGSSGASSLGVSGVPIVSGVSGSGLPGTPIAPGAPGVPGVPGVKLNPPKSPAEHVALARNSGRPHAPAFIEALFDGFVELHGDRLFRDDHALICGLATFEQVPVTVAAHLKGSDLEDNLSCNFGMPHPEGYRKFIRLAKQAEKFGRPLITLIDTPGAYPGAEAEERGQGEAIARCLFELSGLKTPTIAVITGEGGSGGALALALADRVYMYEYAIYSVLSPEGFASILWKDAQRAFEACEVMKLTARDLQSFGMVDGIVGEPEGGAHLDARSAIEALRPILRNALDELCRKDETTLLAERYEKYRKFR